jgi:hypothetical protein
MKRQFLFFMVSLSLCFALASCKHDIDDKPTPIIPCQNDSSVDEMKKWYYFKEGTQWIYQEENTGDLDTATVYQSNEGETWFDYYVFHSNGGWIVNYYFDTSRSIYCLTMKECICHKVFRSRYRPGEVIGEGGIFVYPNILGNFNNIVGFPNGQLTSGTTTLEDLTQQYIIGVDTVRDVIRWNVTTDQSMAGWPSYYLIGKNIGVLHMEFPNISEQWGLIEYHISQ